MKISSVKYLVNEGFKNVWNNRLMSLASVGVLVSCLILTGAAVLFSYNLSTAMQSVEEKNTITVYLNQDLSDLDSIKVGEKIKKISNVQNCTFYSKEEAIEQWRDKLGVVFEGLEGEGNPLPNAYHVTMSDLSEYEDTVKKILAINEVESVSDRSDTAQKLTRLNKIVAGVGFWTVLILGCVSLFIISNTISVTMFGRRLEISIMKSVGATDIFVKVPFIVEGMVIGVISAIFSMGLLGVLYETLIFAFKQILPFNMIPYMTLLPQISVGFIVSGIIFGLLGGSISIRKYLKSDGGDKIEI